MPDAVVADAIGGSEGKQEMRVQLGRRAGEPADAGQDGRGPRTVSAIASGLGVSLPVGGDVVSRQVDPDRKLQPAERAALVRAAARELSARLNAAKAASGVRGPGVEQDRDD